MQNLEDLFVAECRKQGFQPNADAMRQAAIDLAGGKLSDQGLIVMPGRWSISPRDFANSLRSKMPEAFGNLDDEPSDKPATTLTDQMRRQVAASRKRDLPSDWEQARSKYAAGTLTARMMDQIAAARRQREQ